MANRKPRGEGKPDTFDVLGFTHRGAWHRKTGSLIVRRTTSRQRMVAKLNARHRQLRQRRHEPSATTGQWRGQSCRAPATITRGPATCAPWAPSGGG